MNLSRFGNVVYTNQKIQEGIFHVIIGNGWKAYLTQYDIPLEDDPSNILGTVFIGDKMSTPMIEAKDMEEALDILEQRIKKEG